MLASRTLALGAEKKEAAQSSVQASAVAVRPYIPVGKAGSEGIAPAPHVASTKGPEKPAATAFTYTSLKDSKSCIRLLQVQSAHDADSEVRANLVEQQFGTEGPYSEVPYEAVSYAWGGDPDNTLPADEEPYVRIGDRFHRITWSLRMALQSFRLPDAPRTLWIDQVCINQKDKNEKNGQVPLMGQIYQKATQTLIWLGDYDEGLVSAASIMDSYGTLRRDLESIAANVAGPGAKQFKKAAITYGLANTTVRELTELGVRSAADLPHISSTQAKQILDFFGTSWFTRTWPVQEVVLSGKKLVHIGTSVFDWDDVGFFAYWSIHQQYHLDLPNVGIQGMQNAKDVHWYASIYENGFPLASLLRMIRKHDVTDPRDKIFALLDLVDFNSDSNGQPIDVNATPKQSTTVPSPLRVNYHHSVRDVYHALACYQMGREQTVNILTFVQHPRNSSDKLNSPSWVPDWNQGELAEPLWFPEAPIANFSAASPGPTQITCALQSTKSSSLAETCVVYGIQIGEISGVNSCIPPEFSNQSSERANWWAVTSSINTEIEHHRDRNSFFRKSKTSDAFLQTLAMVLTAGRQLPPEGIIRAGDTEPLQKHTHRFVSWFCSLSGFDQDNNNVAACIRLQKQLQADKRFSASQEMAEAFARRVHSVCRNRRLFRISSGQLGLGPANIRRGDFVCILRSGQVPFVLRKDDDCDTSYKVGLPGSYHLVGPCYVYGIMDMELDERLKEAGEKITLV